jgi:signal peptidase I
MARRKLGLNFGLNLDLGCADQCVDRGFGTPAGASVCFSPTLRRAEPMTAVTTADSGSQAAPAKARGFAATLGELAALLGGIFIFFTLFFQPFQIPSGSMKPTLQIGDYFVAAKYSYGYSGHSIPFVGPITWFSGRVLAHAPERGDIVLFHPVSDPTRVLIKRLIGLPGDRIQMVRGALVINGSAVTRERMSATMDADYGGRVRRWRETLPNGVSYVTLDLTENGELDNTPVYIVPAGHYFMMGDNRDDSTDSRVLSEVGYVPFENLIGRAQLIFLSLADGARPWQLWRWPQTLRPDRSLTLPR